MKRLLLVLGTILVIGLFYGGYRYVQSQNINEPLIENSNEIDYISTSESEEENILGSLTGTVKTDDNAEETDKIEAVIETFEVENEEEIIAADNSINDVNNNDDTTDTGQGAPVDGSTDAVEEEEVYINVDGTRILSNGETLSRFKNLPLRVLKGLINTDYKGREDEAREMINNFCKEYGTTLAEIEALDAQEKLAEEQAKQQAAEEAARKAAEQAEQNQYVPVEQEQQGIGLKEGDENQNGRLDFLEDCTITDEQMEGSTIDESKYGNPFVHGDEDEEDEITDDSDEEYIDGSETSDYIDESLDSDSNFA